MIDTILQAVTYTQIEKYQIYIDIVPQLSGNVQCNMDKKRKKVKEETLFAKKDSVCYNKNGLLDCREHYDCRRRK